MADVTTGFDADGIRTLLDRLGTLGVTVREGRQRLIVKGQPGFEHDTSVQALVARLRWHHACNPDEVLGVVREHDAR